jgi:alanyl-tRNA synthetase
MKTTKLFLRDTYLKEYTATLIEATSCKEGFILVLDQTIFFPTGGGQSCDKGNINNFEVIDISERDGIIYHTVQCNNSNIVWGIGQKVFCQLDWDHRFLNMQRHCGEHILSGIFYREYGGVNRGFHMGDEYMTIDLSLEERAEFTSLTWDMAMKAEFFANQVIWSNAPVTVRFFEIREEADSLPLRKALAFDEDISIVCVGDISNPADCVACCGTHPSTAGQVGLIKILKIESYKGMFRVYCEAGERALKIFDEHHEVLSKLNNKYSANTKDLIEKISVQDDKSKAAKNELHILKQSVIGSRIASIEEELKLTPNARILVKEYGDMKVDDLLNIGRPLVPQLKTLLLIVSKQDNTLLLFSDGKIDCGKLVKENASIYQGKGGGNNTSARALFPKFESIETFIDLLDKHLR